MSVENCESCLSLVNHVTRLASDGLEMMAVIEKLEGICRGLRESRHELRERCAALQNGRDAWERACVNMQAQRDEAWAELKAKQEA